MLDFPDSPILNQVWGRWRWDGEKWTFPPAVPAEPPIGQIMDWPSEDVPNGWAVMDGRGVEKRKYPALFSLIGTRFGEPTPRLFGTPDLRGKALVGLDPDDTGRITIADVAQLWEEIGSDIPAAHTHTALGGSHNHGLTDPTHAHGVSQSGHVHTYRDPGHGHGTYQDPHSHGLADPSHTHGKPDPGHSHLEGHLWDWRNTRYEYYYYNFIAGGQVGTHHSGTGNYNDAAGAGINCHAAYADVACHGAGTGLQTYGAVANLDVYAATCNLTMLPASSGLSEIVENDGSGNTQPFLELTKIVYGGTSGGPLPAPLPPPPPSEANFPRRPPSGTIYRNWRWDGRKWDRLPHNLLPGGVRTGMLADWSEWPIIPDHWLVADGRELSREEYPRLFLHIGTTYGAGDGSTTFNLPDARARVTVGWDTGDTGRLTVAVCGLDPAVIGMAGGDERLGSHTHPGTPLPAHAHTHTDPGHAHSVWQSGHAHSYYDPGHAHGIAQNHHGHHQDGGWHNHGLQGGFHGHGQQHGWTLNDLEPWQHWFHAVTWGQSYITHVGTGVQNHGAGIGAWTGGNYAWISVDGAGTGQWIDWGYADVGVWGNYTSITVNNADAGPGIVVHENDDGGAGNIAPSLVVPKLIYAGIDYA